MHSNDNNPDANNKFRVVLEKTLLPTHYLGMICVIAMMLLTTAHVGGRYFLGTPIPGLVEISSYLLVSNIFLTVPYTALVRGHVEITVLSGYLSPKVNAIIDSLTNLLCLLIGAIGAWQTMIRGVYMLSENQMSAVLSIPNAPFIFIVGIGWGLFAITFVLHFLNSIKDVIR